MSQQENKTRISLFIRVLTAAGFFIRPVYKDRNLTCTGFIWVYGSLGSSLIVDQQENEPCSTELESWHQAVDHFGFEKKYFNLVKFIGCADAVLEAFEYELHLGNAYLATDKAFLELDKWCSTYPVEDWLIDRTLSPREWSWHLTESARDILGYFVPGSYLFQRYSLK